MPPDIFTNFTEAVWNAIRSAVRVGVVGRKNSDGTTTITVEGRAHYIYVRTGATQTGGEIIEAYNKGIPRLAGAPCLLVKWNRVWTVVGVDADSPAVTPTTYSVAYHQHRRDNGLNQSVLDLDGMPSSLGGAAGQVLTVSDDENGFYLADAAGGAGAVDSVNGQTGAVVLDSDDIAEGATNLYATATNVGAIVHAAAAKVTPVDADTMPLIDSAASNALKKVTWANIKATLKTYFDTLYVVLLGKSGGQHIRGGTDAGDDLTLESTSHATKGDVNLQPSGGDVIFDPSADATFKLGNQNITESGTVYNTGFNVVASNSNAQFAIVRASANAAMMMSAVAADTFRRFIISVSGRFQWGPGNATRDVTLERTGVGELTLEGHLRQREGASNRLFIEKAAVDGTVQTIIPNGSGDVTKYACISGLASDSAGGVGPKAQTFVLPGGSTTIATAGNTATITVNADGSVTVQRTAGVGTMTITIDMFWQ
jgi:hypothetical protein